MLPPTLIFTTAFSGLLFLPDILFYSGFHLVLCAAISAVLLYQFIERSQSKLPVLSRWSSSLANTTTLCQNTFRRFSSNIYMHFPTMSFWLATLYWLIEGQTQPMVEVTSLLLAGTKIITTFLWYEAMFNSIYAAFSYKKQTYCQ